MERKWTRKTISSHTNNFVNKKVDKIRSNKEILVTLKSKTITMKLSLKFREETNHQNPLLRAKIPITILNLPFISCIVAGDSSDLSFSLRSNFSGGPSLSLSYHPTISPISTTFPPFSVSLKSGIGIFGSPKDSPLVFSAEFNPNCITNPKFSLFIKPQFGNFSLFKSVNSGGSGAIRVGLGNGSVSEFGNGADSGNGSKTQFGEFSLLKSVNSIGSDGIRVDRKGLNGNLGNGSVSEFGNEVDLGNGSENGGILKGFKREKLKGGILSGIFVAARTSMPIVNRAVVNFRWGVDFPMEHEGSKSGFPVLVMNKISLERIEEVKKVVEEKKAKAGDLELLKGMCGWMKRELEDLHKENREMRLALDGLRSKSGSNLRIRGDEREKAGKKAVHSPLSSGEGMSGFEKWRSNKSSGGDEGGNREVKKSSSSSEVSELENELQKAIKAAAS